MKIVFVGSYAILFHTVAIDLKCNLFTITFVKVILANEILWGNVLDMFYTSMYPVFKT